ncbi:sensor histidine kinase [Desulfamplus magnetovallimortis]|nr:sensor histidine kinase [Desulfamplus magnetovallimortis]
MLEYIEDQEGNLTFDQICSPDYNDQFIKSNRDTPNFGYTRSVYWVRIQLHNISSQNTQWFLELQFPNMNEIGFYRPKPYSAEYSYNFSCDYDVFRTGTHYPFSSREVPYNHFVFKISLLPGDQQIVYLRFQSKSSMTFPMTLWTRDGFMHQSQRQLFLSGLFYGGLLLLIVYNMFLWITLRDYTYGYYVGIMFCILMVQIVYEGLAAQYFWYKTPGLNNHAFIFFWLSISIFMQMLTISFLETRTRTPRCHFIIIVFLAIWITTIVLIPFVDYQQIMSFTLKIRIVNILFFIWVNLLVWRQGYQPVRYFLTAWLFIGLSTILVAMVRMNWIPSFTLAEHGYKTGIIMTGIFLSFALADRIHMLRIEKEESQNELLKALRADQAKSHFLSTMSHELRTPLTAILGYAQLLKQKTDSGSVEFTGLDTIEQSGSHLVKLVEELLDLARIENRKLKLNAKPFSLTASLNSLTNMIRLQAAQKNLIFEYKPNSELPKMVVGDETQLIRILLNLLGNAVKFTNQGHVTFKVIPVMENDSQEFDSADELNQLSNSIFNDVYDLENKPSDSLSNDVYKNVYKMDAKRRHLHFSVEDSGCGIPEEQLEQIFTPFVQLESNKYDSKGVGLGLTISRELLRLMGADLKVKSIVGSGSTFEFTLVLPEITSELPISQNYGNDKYSIDETAKEKIGNKSIADFVLPSSETLRNLSHLAEIRAFTELERELICLKSQDKQYANLVEHLLLLLEEFQFDKIGRELNKFQTKSD